MTEGPELDDDALERLRQERFQQRVEKVLATMREERVDFRGVPFVTQDGRIATRIVPVEAATVPPEEGRRGRTDRH